MNLLTYIINFPDEETCKGLFKSFRENTGIKCKKCDSYNHYWLQTVEQFKCKNCGFRTTLKSGTPLENTKLPYRYWLAALYLLTIKNKSFSALELQRQLGHKRYQPIWEMLQKINRSIKTFDTDALINSFNDLNLDIWNPEPVNSIRKQKKRIAS